MHSTETIMQAAAAVHSASITRCRKCGYTPGGDLSVPEMSRGLAIAKGEGDGEGEGEGADVRSSDRHVISG